MAPVGGESRGFWKDPGPYFTIVVLGNDGSEGGNRREQACPPRPFGSAAVSHFKEEMLPELSNIGALTKATLSTMACPLTIDMLLVLR